MEKTMKEAIEITTFHLAGCSFKEFIAANADVDAWLRLQPGFQSRRIAQRDDGSIVDMLIWTTAANATSAMRRLMSELAQSPVHALIDQGTVSWTVASVGHWVEV
ncbi:hypothetical protein ACO0LO_18540 [Undibacterium sp. TJN25]|uniref:hypothetical protein n=1 Tax=Undibacterium sp. TJN25 TaxID=3413056 RepID=UPI003BF27707